MAGIYIHIPFCRKKCSYCDFHFSTTFEEYRLEMVNAIIDEIEIRKGFLKGQELNTIYFGGGTPSLLQTDELALIMNQVQRHFKVDLNTEITFEANPDDITKEKIAGWNKLGVNRLSIGVQSFRPQDLEWMNRTHSAEEAVKSIYLAQEGGIENLTVDLIYGLPDMTIDEWQEQIEKVIGCGVQHVSAYCLTVEKNTALHHFVEKGRIITADEDRQSDEFTLLVDMLGSAGLHQYEISNFCRPGFESKHNSNYWKGVHYLGVGPSAHSFNGFAREWNIAHNRRYMSGIQEKSPLVEREVLTANDRFNEYILTGLRTIYGVELNRLASIKSPPQEFWNRTDEFIQSGEMQLNHNVLTLTKSGKLIADYIASTLFLV